MEGDQRGEESVRMPSVESSWTVFERSLMLSQDQASGNRCDQRQKRQSSSLAPKAQTQTDGKKPSKGSGLRGESPSGKRS